MTNQPQPPLPPAPPQGGASPLRPLAGQAETNQPQQEAPLAEQLKPESTAASQPQKPTSSVENLHLDHLLGMSVEMGASDLHFSVDTPVRIRVNGTLTPLLYNNYRLIATEDQSWRLLTQVLDSERIERLKHDHELDFAYSPASVDARFRCNYFYAQGTLRAVFRQIPTNIKTIDQLGLPEVCRVLSQYPRGLVLVTGPTGSGKSTSLAAMIDEINRTRDEHILTIEDPVEFVHRSKRSLINQREVGPDTHSFANALRAALREDPDVILVGEMRDPETISLGVTAAETGHLVFATLHTQDASQTMDRLIDSFPPDQQDQIRTQLSLTLQGVISQQLIPKKDGSGRVVATEILIANDATRNYLREGKTEQLYSVMQTGGQQGMMTMESCLAGMVRKGIISEQKAKEVASKPDEMLRALGMNNGSV